MVKVDKRKRAELPNYQKNVNSIETSWEEISEEERKILDLDPSTINKMSNEQWYEWDYMSKLIHSKLLLDLKYKRVSSKNTIIEQINRRVGKKKKR